MVKFSKHSLFVAAACSMLGASAHAQAVGFDPRADCARILSEANTADQETIAAWTFGYLAATRDNLRPVDPQNTAALLGNLARACQANPGASLLALVQADNKPAAPAPMPVTPGSEADARQLLAQFYAPGADHRMLTQALLPTEAEVRAVYAEPLASALWSNYSQELTPDIAFGPKPKHSDIFLIHTTTRALFDGQPVLDEFPGGYGKVRQYFKIDVPIVRFKFVEAGATSGLAFDGLMYLNNRWVIMPKPWRSLPN